MKRRGFTLIEVVVVLMLIAITASIVIPLSMEMVTRNMEKKKLVEILTEVEKLKDQSFSQLKIGKISLKNNSLLFFLDENKIKEFPLEKGAEMAADIFFNRNGISQGGEIVVHLEHASYLVIVKKLTGELKIERK